MSKTPYVIRPYRLGVGIVLFNDQGMVFTAMRCDSQNAWQFPQGGIDDGETAEQAVMRELEEEIGTNKAEIIRGSSKWISYDLPEDVADRCWKGKFKGQSQKWFALRFLGTDADINIETEHPEFSQWGWRKLSDVPDLIVPFKRDLYNKIVAEFSDLA